LRRGRLALLTTLLLHLPGCALQPAPPAPARESVELTGVPFFAQEAYQCGPAALATLLSYELDEPVLPAELVPEVYLPERRGSLQIEMTASVRRRGLIPFVLTPSGAELVQNLNAGHPVLVFQNLGVEWLPQWHYAVVVGYDATRQRWILRSGRTMRHHASLRTLKRQRSGAGDWALVALPPGQMPEGLKDGEAFDAISAAEAYLEPSKAYRAWERAVERWPDGVDLIFGAANASRAAGDPVRAADLYKRLLRLDSEHVAARNNYADLLHEAGCPEEAAAILAPALARTPENHPFRAVLDATRAEVDRAPRAMSSCRLPTR